MQLPDAYVQTVQRPIAIVPIAVQFIIDQMDSINAKENEIFYSFGWMYVNLYIK